MHNMNSSYLRRSVSRTITYTYRFVLHTVSYPSTPIQCAARMFVIYIHVINSFSLCLYFYDGDDDGDDNDDDSDDDDDNDDYDDDDDDDAHLLLTYHHLIFM
jgi:hypothetical protein